MSIRDGLSRWIELVPHPVVVPLWVPFISGGETLEALDDGLRLVPHVGIAADQITVRIRQDRATSG